VATPVAWYLMHRWLENYAYKAVLGWWIFAGAGLAAMLIAFATISYQAVRAAVVSPVKSLRSE
jgi:putative ABC transport system permease protein